PVARPVLEMGAAELVDVAAGPEVGGQLGDFRPQVVRADPGAGRERAEAEIGQALAALIAQLALRLGEGVGDQLPPAVPRSAAGPRPRASSAQRSSRTASK